LRTLHQETKLTQAARCFFVLGMCGERGLAAVEFALLLPTLPLVLLARQLFAVIGA
jgi:hypothetical protein